MNYIEQKIDLSGRTAMVTGAAGSLGRAISETISELGGSVVLVDKDQEKLEEFSKLLVCEFHADATAIAIDLEVQEERNRLLEKISTIGSLDILVNNAAFVGTSSLEGWSVPFEEQTVETWRRAIEVNLTAVFDLCKGTAPLLSQSPCGSILNVGSIYGMLGPDWRMYEDTSMSNPAAYAASKGGLAQFTRWMATTLAPKIRVNCLAPGGIYRGQPENFVEKYNSRTPLGRMATEDDFRGAVSFLVSDLSAYVTGQVIAVDGGWSAW